MTTSPLVLLSYTSVLYLTLFHLKPVQPTPATTQPPPLELDITSLFTCPRTCEYFDAFCQRYERTCMDPGRKRECDNKRETMFAHFETFGGFEAVEERCNCKIECITGPDHGWVYVLGSVFLVLLVGCGVWAWIRNMSGGNDAGNNMDGRQ